MTQSKADKKAYMAAWWTTPRGLTFRAWSSMKGRCYRPSCHIYWRYGAVGITVCESWLESFDNFVADMGYRTKELSLDRIDGTGNYEPGNCRWATIQQQNSNRRTCTILEFGGRRGTLRSFALEYGVHEATLKYRLDVGWPIDRALLTVAHHHNRLQQP